MDSADYKLILFLCGIYQTRAKTKGKRRISNFLSTPVTGQTLYLAQFIGLLHLRQEKKKKKHESVERVET